MKLGLARGGQRLFEAPDGSSTAPRRWQHRLDIVGLVVLTVIGGGFGIAYAATGVAPVDADMVWRMAAGGLHYGAVWASDANSRYVYPPALAQLVVPLLPLGWNVFVILWETMLFTALWAATREWSLLIAGVGFASIPIWGLDTPMANPVMLALVGNVQSLVAASILLGLRRPGLWSVVLLTKIFPGIGLLWFAKRGSFSFLGRAVAVTCLTGAVSVLLAPAAWGGFIDFAIRNAGATSPEVVLPIPFAARLPMACLAVVWAARRKSPWVVPVAAAFATPALYLWSWVSIAVVALPLWSRPSLRPSA